MAARVALLGIGLLAFVLAVSCAGGRPGQVATAGEASSAVATIEQPRPAVPASSSSGSVPAERSPAPGRLRDDDAAPLDRQERLLFEMEMQISDLKWCIEEQSVRESRGIDERFVSLPGAGSWSVETEFARVTEGVDRLAPEITDAATRARFESEAVDVVRGLRTAWAAKHPTVTAASAPPPTGTPPPRPRR